MSNNNLKIKLLQYLRSQLDWLSIENIELVASGRTSIDLAIKDIKQSKNNIKKALLPDYLCDSMIVPFEKNDIEYDFYQINFKNGEFVAEFDDITTNDYDIILICDYFIPNKKLYESIANIKNKNKNASIVHDATHTLFSKDATFSSDDYVVCSLRKWFVTTDGGLVIKNSPFNINSKNEHNKYIYYKTKSREYKNLYYKKNTNEIKQKYKQYSDLAEKTLNDDFALYGISTKTENILLSTDFEQEIAKRKKYYNLIKEKIESYDIITCMNGTTVDNCLFTLPIIIDKNRDEVLNLFYKNLIRCAILWEPTQKNKGVDESFTSKSICLDITKNTNEKIDKVLKKIKK